MLTLDNLNQDNAFSTINRRTTMNLLLCSRLYSWVSHNCLFGWMSRTHLPQNIFEAVLFIFPQNEHLLCLSRNQASRPHRLWLLFFFFPSHILSLCKSCWFYFQNISHLDHFPFLSPPPMCQPGSLNQPPTWSSHVYSCPSPSGFYTAVPVISLEQTSYHPFQWLPIVPGSWTLYEQGLWTSLQSFLIVLRSPHWF